VSLCRSNCL